MKKSGLKTLLIILPLLGLAGLVGYRVYHTLQDQKVAASGGMGGRGGPGGRAQTVETARVTRGVIGEKIQLTGSLKPREQVDINPKIAGRLVSILVDTGQAVSRGALIATIEDDEITQQIERAKASIAVVDASIAQRTAELNRAKAELDRKTRLVAEGLLSRLELDALETSVSVAQSQLELARAQRRQSEAEQRELSIRQSQTRVYAPISGMISRRHVDTGAMVSASTPIVTVVSINPMVVEAQAAERDIARIKSGLAVNVTVDGLPGEQFAGRVLRISPLLDPQTRNGTVEIEIPNRGNRLKGEMFARIELAQGTQRETLLLPRDALVYRGEQPGVYLVENEAAKFLSVETGLTLEDKVEIIEGLQEGTVIITRGASLLKDGDRVKVQGESGNAQGQGGNRQQQTEAGAAAAQPQNAQPSDRSGRGRAAQ